MATVEDGAVTVYPCPLCGCSVGRKGEPFTDPTNTVHHINGAHDEDHSGERGVDHREEIEANAVGREPEELEPEPSVPHNHKAALEEIEVDVHVGEETVKMDVPEAFSYLSQVVSEPDQFGLASDQEVRGLEETVESHEAAHEALKENDTRQGEQIDELYSAIEQILEDAGWEIEWDHRE